MERTRLSRAGDAAVRALIARYDLHARAMLPVPIRQVARDEGWQILYSERLAPLYGYAVIYRDTRIMRINAAVTEPYQRMAIAHEMGHVLNGDAQVMHLCAASSSQMRRWVSRRVERQASLAAARILIPGWVVEECETVEEIATVCEVPVELVELLVASR